MIFSSLIFLFAFLPVTMGIYYLLPAKKIWIRNLWLLIASLSFYAFGEPKVVWLMIASILINYGFGLLIDCQRGKPLAKAGLILCIIINLSFLFVFKYLNFSFDTLDLISGHRLSGFVQIPGIALPIGISFYTFQAISYVVDIYRGNGSARRNPLDVGLYISFFPQLIAGPIVRYETIASQIDSRAFEVDNFALGIKRFIIGFAKKVLIANSVAYLADKAFGDVSVGNKIGILYAWTAAICYSIQIFFDFSGYSDMAIGLGKMFGFNFNENFNNPYASVSVTDFWRRWHISLGSWFRDYLYIPLGGSRVGKVRLVFNLFVVWFLTGLWHGADYTFVLWGLMYFVLLTIEKTTGLAKQIESGRINRGIGIFYRIFTLLAVVIGWVLFRADNLGCAYRMYKAMFGIGGDGLISPKEVYIIHDALPALIIALIICIVSPFANKIRNSLSAKTGLVSSFKIICTVLMFVIFLMGISTIVVNSYNPFIYFNF